MSVFDRFAPSYDSDFSDQAIGKILRARVHERLLTLFSEGDHVLEIGCGTGEDALFLAEQRIRVTATDASEKMLSIAREKTEKLSNVRVEFLDIRRPELVESHAKFNGVFSNFGALNCIADRRSLAEWLSTHIGPGGKACFGIMSPYCAWEFIWHVLHLKPDIALRRLRGDRFGDLDIVYPTVKQITEEFSPYFRRTRVMPLGLFLPTSALFDVVQKRPRLMQWLVHLEKRFQDVSQVALFADHYWIEFQRL